MCISVANNRLFVGSIPKNKTRESILEDFGKVTGEFQIHKDCVEVCVKPIKINQSLRMIDMTIGLEVKIFIICLYRGSPRGDIVPPTR